MTELPYADLDPWRPGRLLLCSWRGETSVYVVIEMDVREKAQQFRDQPARVMFYESMVEVELQRLKDTDVPQGVSVTDLSPWWRDERALVTIGGTDWRLWRAQDIMGAPDAVKIEARAQARMS